jgi:hypothetical protein
MRHTKLTLLVMVEQVDSAEAPAPAIETTGEVILARPIRTIRTADTSARLAQRLDGLVRWIEKAAS